MVGRTGRSLSVKNESETQGPERQKKRTLQKWDLKSDQEIELSPAMSLLWKSLSKKVMVE